MKIKKKAWLMVLLVLIIAAAGVTMVPPLWHRI